MTKLYSQVTHFQKNPGNKSVGEGRIPAFDPLTEQQHDQLNDLSGNQTGHSGTCIIDNTMEL